VAAVAVDVTAIGKEAAAIIVVSKVVAAVADAVVGLAA
jgi:hypothetical protein